MRASYLNPEYAMPLKHQMDMMRMLQSDPAFETVMEAKGLPKDPTITDIIEMQLKNCKDAWLSDPNSFDGVVYWAAYNVKYGIKAGWKLIEEHSR